MTEALRRVAEESGSIRRARAWKKKRRSPPREPAPKRNDVSRRVPPRRNACVPVPSESSVPGTWKSGTRSAWASAVAPRRPRRTRHARDRVRSDGKRERNAARAGKAKCLGKETHTRTMASRSGVL